MRPLFIQILNRLRSGCNVIPYRPRTFFRLYWRDILLLSINTCTKTFFHPFFIQIHKLSNFTIISNGILYVCRLEYGLSFIKTVSVYTSCKTEKVSNHNFQIVIESPIQSFLIVVHTRSQHLKMSLIGELNELFLDCYKRDISKYIAWWCAFRNHTIAHHSKHWHERFSTT